MIEEYINHDSAMVDVTSAHAQTTELNLCENLEYWMTRLPPAVRAVPIVRLAIPGSHNSMTYTIERNDDVGPDKSEIIINLARCFPSIVKPIIFNWSVNQDVNVKEQLNSGIRYLDLRVATKGIDRNIHFLHGLYGAEITKPLEEIANWLSAHPDEIVILDFQHFYRFNESDHKNLIDKIKYIFRGQLCPICPIKNISLKWLNMEKYQVLVVYRNITASNYNNLWPTSIWPTPWPNTVYPSRLINFLNMGLKIRSLDIGFVSQCLLTPNKTYVVKHIFGNLRESLFPSIKKVTLPWISENSPGSGGMNVVITDFISTNNFLFPKTVIQRNVTFLESQYYF